MAKSRMDQINLSFKTNQYLDEKVKKSDALKKQFIPSLEELENSGLFADPLQEENHFLIKGLIQKYPNRVLLELTLSCAAYCRFCTRRRKVSDQNSSLSKKEIDAITKYLKSQKELNEVIISGGDPLIVPDLLVYALKQIQKIEHIKIIRVHTRIPVSNPKIVSEKVVRQFSKVINQVLYVSVHFEHPDEITKETIEVIKKLRKSGAILYSQTVFLKGVNDSVEILKTLFTRLVELGVRPYYIYRCDPVVGAKHFIVPFEKEVEIMTELRKQITGIAYPTYIIDAPLGSGKIPVPLNFWKNQEKTFTDYSGKNIDILDP